DYVASDSLFLKHTGAAMTSYMLQTLLLDIAAAVGLREKANVNPHNFRHFFTDMLVEARVDIKTIQELLGHENPQTTWLYIKTNEERKRRAVEGICLPGLTTESKRPDRERQPHQPEKEQRKLRRIALHG